MYVEALIELERTLVGPHFIDEDAEKVELLDLYCAIQ